MTVSELKLLLNLYPDNLEVVLPIGDDEYDTPALKVTKVITSFMGEVKYYFTEDVVEDGEKIEEVLLLH